MKRLSLFAAALWVGACGTNEVTVEIRGGDGHLLRLDANDLEYRNNRLREAGSYVFRELKSGEYTVSVVAGGYAATKVLTLESPPMTGVSSTPVTFDVPRGANEPFERSGSIVFASTPTTSRNWDLFSVDVASGEMTRLTDTRENEQHPDWSPDGRRLLFTGGDVMSNIDVWVMNADGSGRTRLTEHAERDAWPRWSPDGATIAFVSQREGDVSIWLMDADGGNKRKLVQGRQPSWAPDGRRLYFTSSAFDENDEIYRVDVDGGNLTRLTNDKRIDWHPAPSPDGTLLALASERFGGQELMIAGGDFTHQVRVTIAENSFEVAPTWSPDGRAVAYAGKMNIGADGNMVTDDKGRPDGVTYDIYVLPTSGFDFDEAAERPVLPINLTNTADRVERTPRWRPN